MILPEALQTLDVVVAAAIEEPPRASPPPAPAVGSCYLVASSPSGAWAGRAHCMAAYTGGGWRFVQPRDGLTAYVKSSGVWAVHRAGAWEFGVIRGSSVAVGDQQVVGERCAAIAGPSGGTTVDSQARTSIDQVLAALRQHGLVES
jgi:hypothetical protein